MFLRAQCTLEHDSGLASDAFVNVWHFDSDNATPGLAETTELAARLHTFYSAIGGNLGNSLSGKIDVAIYDMTDPKPRVPIWTTFTTGLGVGSTSLPEEVALCLSMTAAPVSGEPAARKRGRVFLGPFSATMSEVTSGRARPTTTLVPAILAAARTLATGPNGGDPRLSVFSPTTLNAAPTDYDAAFNDVVDLWIDNAWDIQRRRGAPPTTKTHQSLP